MSGGVSAATVIGGIGAAASAISAISTLTKKSGGSAPETTMSVSKPPVMPEPDDAAVRAAKRRSLASQSARQGRASTILSDDYATAEPLGG